MPVQDIQIRATPLIAEKGAESIYFSVSQRLGSRRILQAIFEPGYAPTEMEFRLLKAAASLAAVVLELSLLSEEPAVDALLTSQRTRAALTGFQFSGPFRVRCDVSFGRGRRRGLLSLVPSSHDRRRRAV